MGRTPWATYLWPGLPQLWRQGSWSGLAAAIGFAVAVNLAIAASLLWVELLPDLLRNFVWLGVAVVWVGSASVTYRSRGRDPSARNSGKAEVGLGEAIEQYLKGNWFETEQALEKLLRQDPRDIEAGLMRATLMRRRGRLDEAAKGLDRMERLDERQKWVVEIQHERELLQKQQVDSRSEAPQEDRDNR